MSGPGGDVQMIDLHQPQSNGVLPPPTWGNVPTQSSPLQRSTSELSSGRRTVQLDTHYFSRVQWWLSFLPASAAFMLAIVNIIVARYEFFYDLLQPQHTWLCPSLLFAVGIGALYMGYKTDLAHLEVKHSSRLLEQEEANPIKRKVSCVRRYMQMFTPGGKLFHHKVQFLQFVGILNMALVLKTSLETGQLRRYIVVQTLVISVNAISFPLLFTRPHPMYHTIGVMFMDIGIDAVFGAMIPIIMFLDIGISAIYNRRTLEREQVPDAHHIRFLIVANRFVPPTTQEMVQLLIPYVTLTLRLGDVRKARKLLNIGGLPSAGWSNLHKKLAAIGYISFGIIIFLLISIRVFLYTRCQDKKAIYGDHPWGEGCLQQSYFTTDICRCIYFHFDVNDPRNRVQIKVEDTVAMLKESELSLRILSVWNWKYYTFPSTEHNRNLMWIFFHGGKLEHLGSMQENKKLERLVIRDHQLHTVPNVSGLQKLKWLDVQNNSVASAPLLTDVPHLERLMMSENKLEQLPELEPLGQLKKLRAAFNSLRQLPSLSNNTQLTVLDLTSNLLEDLGEHAFDTNSDLKEIKISENKLRRLPRMGGLKILKELDVANNQLPEIPDLNESKKLTRLNVSGNLLTRMLDFSSFENLTDVDVCDNRFTSAPKVAISGRRRHRCLCCENCIKCTKST